MVKDSEEGGPDIQNAFRTKILGLGQKIFMCGGGVGKKKLAKPGEDGTEHARRKNWNG